MPRTCTICTSPDRAAIDAAIAVGTSFRAIARQFSAGHDSIQRHATNHLAQAIKEAKEAQAIQSGSIALERMARGEGIVDEILNASWNEKSKEPELALKTLGELRRQVELRAKLEGELDERPQVNVWLPAPWPDIEAAIARALAPYAEARDAVAVALMALEEGGHAKFN